LEYPGLLATAVYRFGNFVYAPTSSVRRFSPMLRCLYLLLSRLSQIVTGIWIHPAANIGPGLYIAHFGGVIIGPCEIGPNCNIGHGVTIGKSGRGVSRGRPVVGARVNIATGACVLGNIEIGDDVLVGANSVVNRSLPPRAVAFGVPAVVISAHGSFDYVEYHGMNSDAARTSSFTSIQTNKHDHVER
jgi:serine O-acetyltransferase